MLNILEDWLFTYQSLLHALGVNALLALAVYTVLAIGQIALGQAAFMGVGAYASALLTVKFGAPFPAALLASMASPALLAYLIGAPTLRLSGIYLAIATLGLGEVLRVLFLNWDFAGGALGLNGIPERAGFVWIFGALATALTGLMLVARSRIGRAMEAIRADEAAAGVMGVNLPAYKLGALVVSAAIAGLAGAMNAHVSSFIGPNDYGFDQAVTILSFALLGGVGSPFGPVLGAVVLTALPEVLRPLHDYRLVIDGFIIVCVVIFLPKGILPWRIRRVGASA